MVVSAGSNVCVEWTESTVYFDCTQMSGFFGVDTVDSPCGFSAENVMAVAVLPDGVGNGTFAWDYQTGFSSGITPAPKALIEGNGVPFDKVGADNFSLSYKIGEYKCTFAVTFGEFRSGEFKVEGTVQPIRLKNMIVVESYAGGRISGLIFS